VNDAAGGELSGFLGANSSRWRVGDTESKTQFFGLLPNFRLPSAHFSSIFPAVFDIGHSPDS
jgi:hypothetical protein